MLPGAIPEGLNLVLPGAIPEGLNLVLPGAIPEGKLASGILAKKLG